MRLRSVVSGNVELSGATRRSDRRRRLLRQHRSASDTHKSIEVSPSVPGMPAMPSGPRRKRGKSIRVSSSSEAQLATDPLARRSGSWSRSARAGGSSRRSSRPTPPPQSALVRLACADDDAQGQALEVFWDYELDRRILEDEGWEDLAAKGFDAAAPVRRLPPHAALELRHRHRPEPLPGALPGRHPDRRLPDGAAAQGAPAAAGQPLHRRRHRPGQDDRGRPDRPRAAAAQEGARRSSSPRRRRCSSSGRASSRIASASSSRSSTATT